MKNPVFLIALLLTTPVDAATRIVCNQGESMCNYMNEPVICHNHFRRGYEITHCTVAKSLEEHYKSDPLYKVHHFDQTEYPDSKLQGY